MVLVLTRPAPPGSQPTTTHSSGPIDPAIFEEPEIGFVNGLKTGLKALVNATADTGAGLISLGQWDPDDVWQVNRMTDVGYDGALVAAKIATAAASAAATGGLAGGVGKVGQVARAVDRVDALGNVLVGVQGAANIVAVGNVNLQNGMQVVGGVLGGAQLKGAANGGKVVAKADEAVAAADSRILFAQKKIDDAFSTKADVPVELKGRKIEDVAKDLVDKKLSPDVIEISYTKTSDGKYATLNNRGLAALSLAGLKPTITKFVPWDALSKGQLKRFDETPLLKDDGQLIPGPWIPMVDVNGKVLRVIELAN